jgi:hypothetical protein
MLTKIVDGQEVQCSAEEEAEILAEWEKNNSLPKNPQGTPTPIEGKE